MNYCYFNRVLMQPTRKFVRFTNKGHFQAKCILQYTLSGRTSTHQAILSKRNTRKYPLPFDAVNICLNMLNMSVPNEDLFYHECISGQESICYEIFNTAENPMCVKTPC